MGRDVKGPHVLTSAGDEIDDSDDRKEELSETRVGLLPFDKTLWSSVEDIDETGEYSSAFVLPLEWRRPGEGSKSEMSSKSSWRILGIAPGFVRNVAIIRTIVVVPSWRSNSGCVYLGR